MAAIDVSVAVLSVSDQVAGVLAVGAGVLGVLAVLWSFRVLRGAFGGSAGPRSGGDVSAGGPAPDPVAPDAAHKANTAEYERLGAVWQGWQDAIDGAASRGGVAPAARQNMVFYDALVSRGMDPESAIAAVEARNAAVARTDALADARDAAEHAAAVVQYQAQPVDLTVRLGDGWAGGSGEGLSFDKFSVYESGVRDGLSHAEAMRRADHAELDHRQVVFERGL